MNFLVVETERRNVGRHRILLVDDEEIMRSSLSDWLKEDGYYVVAVEDGNKAIDKVKFSEVCGLSAI